MPAEFAPSGAELRRLLPEMVLVVAGTLAMVLAAFRRSRQTNLFSGLAFTGFVAALAASVFAFQDPGTAFRDMLVVDGFTTFFRVLVISVGALATLASTQYLRREEVESGEYYALLLLSVAGQCVMVSTAELIMIFIGLEISSISSYILAGYLRDDKRANEAALKYFLLGSFATAFLLYGVAWIYGVSGSTFLLDIRSDIQAMLSDPAAGGARIVVLVAAALLFVGLAFKVSSWPFQSWAPDVYQGAPAPVAAFLSAGPKAAAFAVLLRVFMTAFEPVSQRWQPLVWVSALGTMVIGNFAALAQTNIKRMLAYSSIAHAGYVLVAVAAASRTGIASAMFYLAAYALMNLGAFGVVAHVCRQGERYVEIRDFSGLGVRQPATAALFSIFLLSLIGVPLTGGFFGKFYIFKSALDADLVWLAVLGLLTSVVAAYYYLRILVVMYMHEPGDTSELPPLRGALSLALYASALGTLLLGVFPSLLLDFVSEAAVLAK